MINQVRSLEVLQPFLQPGEQLVAPAPREHGSQEWAFGSDVIPVKKSSHTTGNTVLLDVDPGGAVEPVLITGKIHLKVEVLRGMGAAIIYNVFDEGEVRFVSLDKNSEPLRLARGDAYAYLNLSGDAPLTLRDDCTPAFDPADELQLTKVPDSGEPDDKSGIRAPARIDGRRVPLPVAFWRAFAA